MPIDRPASTLRPVAGIYHFQDANPKAKMARLLPAAVLRQVILHPVHQKPAVSLELAPEGRTPEFCPPLCGYKRASACPDGLKCKGIHTQAP